jgi:hypothetical protein
MDVLTIIAWVAIAAAALYLVIALVTWPQRRRQRLAEASAPHDGHPIVHIAERPPQLEEPTPDRMRKLAGIFAAIAARTWSEPFDFTIESVAAVDRAIVSGWGDEAPDVDFDIQLAFGAYLGEVLVRRTRGRWVTGFSDDDPASVLLLLPGRDEDAVNFSPFLLVREKFAHPYRFDLSIAFTALEQKLKELQAA